MNSESERDKADSYILALEFVAGNSERSYLERALSDIPGTSFFLAPKPALGKASIHAFAINPDNIVSTALTVATLLGHLAAIARLLLELAKRRGRDEVTIKTKSGYITIRGDMPQEVVVDMLREKARITSRTDARHAVAREKLRHQSAEVKEKIAFTRGAVKAYEGLVRTFMTASPLKEKWQHEKLYEYRKILAGYRRQLTVLERQKRRLAETSGD